jgi:hypothetical protein
MTNFKKILLAATAMSLVAGAAYAGSGNDSYIAQDGFDNSTSVLQSGSSNDAGESGLAIRQEGYNNKLVIEQSGSGNDIGLEGAGIRQENRDQSTVSFEIDITQSSSGNTVGSVEQVASGDAGSGVRNKATISQTGGFFGLGLNRVGSVYQERKSSGRNVLTIEQNGVADRIETVYQRSNTGGNAPNTIAVTMNGSGSPFSVGNGWGSSLSGFAAGSGATSSALKQGDTTATSRGNSIALNVSGAFNNFGVTQNGLNNTVGTLNLGGLGNEIGIRQNGNNNEVALADVGGFANNIGIRQLQNNNGASVTVSGDRNITGVFQDGDFNSATVVVDGDQNGGFGSFGLNAAGNLVLSAGLFEQIGDSNSLDATVTGNNNVFATKQSGDDNSISHSVVGNGNQFAVLQTGNGNVSVTSQIGNGNVIGVSQ